MADALGAEVIPTGEAAAIGQVVEASRKLLERDAKPVVQRGQHPKQHGCVRAEFTVLPNLPPEYRAGLFREPATYAAWVRFSNGGQHDDRNPDAHGMAVKVLDVPGPQALEHDGAATQDFVMVDSPSFFIRDAIEYAHFSGVLLKAKAKEPSALRSALFFLPQKYREAGVIALLHFGWSGRAALKILLRFLSRRPSSPLRTQYWSTTPYLLGENGPAMKFMAVPAEGVLAEGPPSGASAHYLREAMRTRLDAGEAVFNFQVQVQRDVAKQPIEDPRVEWDETEFLPLTVARIRIPSQTFDTPERMAFGENLSFTPWHALAEHRPLGGINRTRKAVYIELSRLRHELNRAPQQEPSGSPTD